MESYFLSDIHLKSVNERRGQILLRFLLSLTQKNPGNLFLLGDIFDLWISGHPVFKKKFSDVIRLMELLKSQGWKIYFFEGNHDLHIHPYWRDELGAEVFTEAQVMDIDGLKVRLEHGDLINLEDEAYLRLRRFLRHPMTERVGHLVPGQFWQKVGQAWAGISRKKSIVYQKQNADEIQKMIRHHAHRVYNSDGFDLIISGHMHVRDDYQFEVHGKKIRSINLGSWFEEIQILKLNAGQVEWVRLD